MDDTALKSNGTNGMAVADGTAASGNLIPVLDTSAEIAGGTAVENSNAARANVSAVVGDAAKASGAALAHGATAETLETQCCPNPFKSIPVVILKGFMFLRFSGVTKLVNDCDKNIVFYTTTMDRDTWRFCLKAHQTKHINMRKLSASHAAKTAIVVKLKFEGNDVALTFIPQDFIIYKKFKFSQDKDGKLVCPKLNRVVRYPRHVAH